MRQIKFRAWDGAKVLPVIEIIYDQYGGCDVFTSHDVNAHALGANSLMQYTGFKDGNEKEIYEGDIVRITPEDEFHEHDSDCEIACQLGENEGKVIVVAWNDEQTGYTFDGEALFGHEYNFPVVSDGYVTEVLGNIFENSELIK